jgi:hypothetical protein
MARKKPASKRKYGKKASEKVERAMHEMKRGQLKSGRSGKKVTSREQAIAIGLSQARRAGGKVPPAPAHATVKKSSAQLDREIADARAWSRGGRSHATMAAKPTVDANLFAVEIDPSEFEQPRKLPEGATWRDDLGHLAEAELSRGRTYRRPQGARYRVSALSRDRMGGLSCCCRPAARLARRRPWHHAVRGDLRVTLERVTLTRA